MARAFEVCGHTCKPDPPCEAKCNRLRFSDRPVRIADLQAWVCREADVDGWPAGGHRGSSSLSARSGDGRRFTVVGAGPAGLTCAYYLARLGFSVVLLDAGNSPDSALLAVEADILPRDVLARDVSGVLMAGVEFAGGVRLGADVSVADLVRDYASVFLATGPASRDALGDLAVTQHSDGTWRSGTVLAGGGLVRGDCSAVQAVADGRRAARAMAGIPQA